MHFLSRDTLQEIFFALKKNKLRTALTGFSVSWGIFILIVLFGAGNGLKNSVMDSFSERAVNRIMLYSGKTSMPYRGLKSGRFIRFSENEVQRLANDVEQSDLIAPCVDKSQSISYKSEYGNFTVRGTTADYRKINGLKFAENGGRFINSIDIKSANKVIVLDKKIANKLFKNDSALGKYVKVGQVMFKVVGINSKKEGWEGAFAYIPFTTAQIIFNPDKKFSDLMFTANGLDTKAENELFTKSLRMLLGRTLGFDYEDKQAMWINNSQEDYVQTIKIFSIITMVVSLIGLLMLIAGIVGVSNIMLVTVKERTREIGIRKAIGAPSSSILKSIILESIIITSIFGYIGMMAGIGLTELVAFALSKSEDVPFKDPTVGIDYVLAATAILIIAGVIAGYFPARKAVNVKPIEAMRQE